MTSFACSKLSHAGSWGFRLPGFATCWGGAVGIELHQPLVDGGGTTPPQFGPYNLDQKWIIEGRGVEPDIVVQNMPGDVLKGKDAQLEAAIANIQKRLTADPKEIPAVPAFPIKRK